MGTAEQIERLAQVSRDRPHDLCPITFHCHRCGASVRDLCLNPRPCLDAPNVQSLVPVLKLRSLAAG